MPTLGAVAMSKNRDCDAPAARTGNTTADKPSRHAAPPTPSERPRCDGLINEYKYAA